jgi:hypothetical protein
VAEATSKPAWANSLKDPISKKKKKKKSQKRAGVGLEFKPQYHIHTKKTKHIRYARIPVPPPKLSFQNCQMVLWIFLVLDAPSPKMIFVTSLPPSKHSTNGSKC